MKMIPPAALATVAGVAIAQSAINEAKAGASTTAWKASPQSRRLLRKLSSGIVDPRRVVSKEQRRESRADSKIDTINGQKDGDFLDEYEYSFTALVDKFTAHLTVRRHLDSIGRDIDEHFAPGACAVTASSVRSTRKPTTIRELIILILLFLIVLGALWNLVEYLLFATRASACSLSTVYVPVTYTVTAGMSNGSSTSLVSPASGSSSETSTVFQTTTSTQTVTSYVTVGPETSSTLAYIYTVDPSGSTDWINGVSPSAGVSVVTATTSIFVTPAAPTESMITFTSTEYVTAPGYITTEYSFGGPDITVTSTSTSTNYMTYTLSYVSPTSTDTRSSFPGIGSAGWNSSSMLDPASPAALSSSIEPQTATLTSVYYQSSGNPTTSTTTTSITTTVGVRYTITTTLSSSSRSAFVTTITALPVTITDQSGSQPTSAVPVTTSSPALNSISTTVNGSAVSAITTSASSSLGMFPAAHSSSSMSPYGYTPAVSSLASSLHPSSIIVFPNSSSAGATTQTPSTTGSSMSNSSTTVSALSTTAYTSSGVKLTTTMSTIPQPSATTSSAVNSTQSVSPAAAITSSSSPSALTASITLTISIESSSAAAVSLASDNSTIAMSTTASNLTTVQSITSTLSVSSTAGRATPTEASSSASIASGTSSLPTGSLSTLSSATSLLSTLSTSTHSSTTSVVSKSSGFATILTTISISPTTGSGTSNSFPTSATATQVSITTTSSAASSTASVSSLNSATAVTGNYTLSTLSPAKSSTTSTSQSQSLSRSVSSTNIVTRTTSTSSFSNPFPPTSATATPTAGCGEHGNFTIGFDNLPNFMPSNANKTDITQAPPIENPYYHLTFSDGYVYAPQPREPFTPVSPPHLAVFLPAESGKRVSTPFGNYSKPGEISDGPRESISAFWFNAYSAFLGCDNRGPEDCTMVVTSYKWSPAKKAEVLANTQNTTITPCPTKKDCKLQQVNFPSSYRALTGLQIQAFVGNEERMFFMDDLDLHWTNNTCAAGMLRQSSS